MFSIPKFTEDESFLAMWEAARSHLRQRFDPVDPSGAGPESGQGPYPFRWIRHRCDGPYRDHHSFFLHDVPHFVALQDADRPQVRLIEPRATDAIARAWNGHACVLPMRCEGGRWMPLVAADSDTGLRSFARQPDGRVDETAFDRGQHGFEHDPRAFRAEPETLFTDEELHDFAIEVVAGQVDRSGGGSIRTQNDPKVLPSISWIDADGSPQWAIVQAVRYGDPEPGMPIRWPAFKRVINEALRSASGLRAVVGIASAHESSERLRRGAGMYVRWHGFERT
ncbi:hypothetical protein OAG01_00170 [bacterium]|nr:hypothetical protein [bacterium]MDA7668747.1 hypothetical protein [bacterium]MDB4632840.1 hypothetical protein [bacterium]